MDNQDTQVLSAARRWVAAGHRFMLVSVAKTWGSAPRPVGAWMALRDDGMVEGSVSGGCIETDLIDRLLAMTDENLLTDELYLSVFTRRPTDEERSELAAWLAKHGDRREKAIATWAWSMLTSMMTAPSFIFCTMASLTTTGVRPLSECMAPMTTSALTSSRSK